MDESIDPIHNCVGEWALAIRQKHNKLYVATSSNDIQILSLPDGDRDGVLDRFVAPVNHIAVSKKGQVSFKYLDSSNIFFEVLHIFCLGSNFMTIIFLLYSEDPVYA